LQAGSVFVLALEVKYPWGWNFPLETGFRLRQVTL
jgi:hypothetical protein